MREKITLNHETDIFLKEAFSKFINEKRATNKSEYTINYYEDRWRYFEEFLKTKNILTTKQLTTDLITEYILHTKKRNPNISNITINNYLRGIRCAIYYFIERGYTNNFKIKLLTAKKPVKQGYTIEEQERLVKKPNMKNCTFSDYRNWVIICHLFATGNRARTIRGIKIKDVNLSEKCITLYELKNNETYEIPINDIYYPILKEYMNIRKGKLDDYLFCNQYGNQLSPDGLRTIIKKYNHSRGVEKTSIHLFRHTFAKTWILSDGSSKKLQRALGHSSPTMVDEYLNIYGRELKEDFGKFTPLANLKDVIHKEKVRIEK